MRQPQSWSAPRAKALIYAHIFFTNASAVRSLTLAVLTMIEAAAWKSEPRALASGEALKKMCA